MENSPRSHPQLVRRSTPISKLPRQPDMDDRSASPPIEPRKTRPCAAAGNNRVSTTTTPFGDHVVATTSPCLSPVDYRSESPPASLITSTMMTLTPEEPRTSPPRRTSPPPVEETSANDPSEDESVALARMLMAQEAMESYALSADYLRYNSAQYSQEDLEALQAALDSDDEEDDDELEMEGGGETNDMEYEMMLRLGEAIGDVKQERWKLKAEQHIAKLPTFAFSTKDVKHLDENDSRCKCLVCQFSYEEADSLRELPCGHCFHTECVDQWLKEKDCCAYCRQPIVPPS